MENRTKPAPNGVFPGSIDCLWWRCVFHYLSRSLFGNLVISLFSCRFVPVGKHGSLCECCVFEQGFILILVAELTKSLLGSVCTGWKPLYPEKHRGCCTWQGCQPCVAKKTLALHKTDNTGHFKCILKCQWWTNRQGDKSDLLVLFTSFWCSVRTRSFASGGMKTKSMEASSSKTPLQGGLGEPKSSFVCRREYNGNQLCNGWRMSN